MTYLKIYPDRKIDKKHLTVAAYTSPDVRAMFKQICKSKRIIASYEYARLLEEYVAENKYCIENKG